MNPSHPKIVAEYRRQVELHQDEISQVEKNAPGLDRPETHAVAFSLLARMPDRQVQRYLGFTPHRLHKLHRDYYRITKAASQENAG